MAATPQVIPTVAGNPNYTMRTRLDGRDYLLRFQWNQREERWYFDIFADTNEPLAVGIKIIPNRPLLRFYQWDQRLPPGEFVANIDIADDSPPGLYEMAIGERCELTYFPVLE